MEFSPTWPRGPKYTPRGNIYAAPIRNPTYCVWLSMHSRALPMADACLPDSREQDPPRTQTGQVLWQRRPSLKPASLLKHSSSTWLSAHPKWPPATMNDTIQLRLFNCLVVCLWGSKVGHEKVCWIHLAWWSHDSLPACEVILQEDLEINSAISFLGLKKGEGRTKDFLE